MNYLVFKEVMASILSKFRCQECATLATEKSFSIQNLSGNNLDLTYECPHCKTRAVLSVRTGEIKKELLQTNMGRDMLQKAFSQKNISDTENEKWISSEEIIKIENILSKDTTVTDLINGE